MKTTHKKVAGGLLVGLLVASIGAVFATAQTDDTSDDTATQKPEWFGGRHDMNRLGMLAAELTDEQQTELEELMTTLRDQNATPDDIFAAIQEKLDEYGVLDTRLDNEITQTEQRLTMLTRQKELRDKGYTWDEINTIIQEEFDFENTTGVGPSRGLNHGFGHGPQGRPGHGPCMERPSTEDPDISDHSEL